MNQQLAWVTGGKHGLGRAIADVLSDDGMEVLAPGSREVDVTDPVAVREYCARSSSTETETKALGIDLLVCNAGVTEDRPLGRMSERDWDRVMEVNLKGSFICAREVARGMVKRRIGHIVFISSYSAVHPPAGQANYAASKAGLIGLMKSMARELGPRNIRVNVVCPGFLETAMTEPLSESVKEMARSKHVLGRFNTPSDVGKFIMFLHQTMPHTSGQVFNLDSRIV